jgi:exodeoxyribonuclease VII small subunit
MARSRTAGSPETETTFEQAMNELEELVHALEDGTLPLDLLVEKYERGAGLLKLCRQRLDTAQQRIEFITRTAAGGVALEPAPGEGTAPTAPKSVRKPLPPDHANSDEIRLFQL